MNKRSLLAALLFLATACTSGKMMTLQNYQDVSIGQKKGELEAEYGEPYEVRKRSNDQEEYIYIERVPISHSNEAMREYVFVISDGKITSKKMSENRPQNLRFTH